MVRIDAEAYNLKKGVVVNHLLCLGYSHYDKYHYVIVRCNLCGTKKPMRWGFFINGFNKSCGCKRDKELYDRSFKHGLCFHPLYYTYNNLKHANRLCKNWRRDFLEFFFWCIDNAWEPGDKIKCNDKNKVYSPKTSMVSKKT